ncbi:hypothetical protein D9M72_322310 [compost metagenome]
MVGFAEPPKIGPSRSDICSKVEDHNPLIQRVARCVLLDCSHYPADELDERAETAKDAPNHRNREVLVIEAFAEHLGLHDYVQLMSLKSSEDLIVRGPLSRVHKVCVESSCAECLRDLEAVVVIECRRDYF